MSLDKLPESEEHAAGGPPNNSMQKTNKQKPDKSTDENGEPMNPFAEMLRVMDIEYLIRFRCRLEKVGRKRMVEILSDEIEERKAIEKERRDADRVRSAQR